MVRSGRLGRLGGLAGAVLVTFVVGRTSVWVQPAYDVKANYEKSEHLVPMRDGVKLHTSVYVPRGAHEPLPFVMQRTPYGTPPYGPNAYRERLGLSPHTSDFEREGFIFVFQDVRGRFRSEGKFVETRPFVPQKTGVETDESSDTYDTIEWLLKNVPNNNGRVGMWGNSYNGWQTVLGMIEAHPALRAAAPQAAHADMYLGDDWHHNGAFRLAHVFPWYASNMRTRDRPYETRWPAFDPGTPDAYSFYLRLGSLSEVNRRYFDGGTPGWDLFVEHPDYDEYWQRQTMVPYLKDIHLPVLNVSGWFDCQDPYGQIRIYEEIEKTTPNNRSTLVVGPLSHGGWNNHVDGDSLGSIQFAGSPAVYFRNELLLPFFRYYLKDKGEFDMRDALVYETGTNKWRAFDRWPPREGVAERKLYLAAEGRLTWAAPQETAEEGYDSYISDPAKPVPSTAEIRWGEGTEWMVEDQRFAARRPDVLVYQTEELSEEVTFAGPIRVNLVVSTSGTDSDFVVKVIDVYPSRTPKGGPSGGYQMLLVGDAFRAKYRHGFEKPVAMVPGQPTELQFDLRDRSHRFLKGHRIMVQIQSTWFPAFDRNPHVFMNIYRARESEFKKATQRVYRSSRHGSHIVLPVIRNLP